MSDFNYFRPNPKPTRKLKTKRYIPKRSKRNKQPTAKQRKRWERIRELGCSVNNYECEPRVITIHHCFTGQGGRKDHDKVIGLCYNHHISKDYGIDGRGRYSKITWQEHYGTEQYFLDKLEQKLKADKFALT